MLPKRLQDERGSWTLIGLLVAVAVGMIIYFVVLMPKLSGGTGAQAEKAGLLKAKQGQTVYGAAMDKGKETSCSSNLRQIRMAIDAYKIENNRPPASLQELKLGSAGLCPATRQPYQYDPNTGAVRCATPGHNGF